MQSKFGFGRHLICVLGSALLALGVAGCNQSSGSASVTDQRLVDGIGDDANWMQYGKDYSDARYSGLNQINEGNVSQLGLAWSQDLNNRYAVEATPLVIDGVMYIALPGNIVWALDGKTGKKLWEYTPQMDLSNGRVMCCGHVTRGLAAWGENIYAATIDGQLIAIERKTGKEVWKAQASSMKDGYTITGAPRVVKGMVIIGNGGAEFRARGYVTAYDAKTGKQKWRFYTVPGNPADGFENKAMELAAKTWTGEWWKHGGGGTVWDAMAYDPKLNLLYLGVGNGGPLNAKIRSPQGGDNLFLSSIVALNPDTGEYVWHFQETPAETWDFTASQQMTLIDLEIGGTKRQVIMQAPKNGFFYLIDRKTGEFISARNYTAVNWATGVDPKTGKPIEAPNARYYDTDKGAYIVPGIQGAHDWQGMSYSAQTGLVYIPVQNYGMPHKAIPPAESATFVYTAGVDHLEMRIPDDAAVVGQVRKMHSGELIAWDPVKQERMWSVPMTHPWNGGVVSTAGGLVFQGNGNAEFAAYAAKTGKKLWSFATESSTVAAPITYTIDGEQYVAVMTGWGGAFSNGLGGIIPAKGKKGAGQLLVFKLGGKAKATVFPEMEDTGFDPPKDTASAGAIARGEKVYYKYCMPCHGVGAVAGPNFPDLRRSGFLQSSEAFNSVVLDGALAANGMSSFADKISKQDSEALRAFIIRRAHTVTALDASAAKKGTK